MPRIASQIEQLTRATYISYFKSAIPGSNGQWSLANLWSSVSRTVRRWWNHMLSTKIQLPRGESSTYSDAFWTSGLDWNVHRTPTTTSTKAVADVVAFVDDCLNGIGVSPSRCGTGSAASTRLEKTSCWKWCLNGGGKYCHEEDSHETEIHWLK